MMMSSSRSPSIVNEMAGSMSTDTSISSQNHLGRTTVTNNGKMSSSSASFLIGERLLRLELVGVPLALSSSVSRALVGVCSWA
jgi:hypothetical protein